MTLDRRSLIRQYKLTPRSMGVGAVRNTSSGKALVFVSPSIFLGRDTTPSDHWDPGHPGEELLREGFAKRPPSLASGSPDS